jgi:hypothetical protein
MKRLDPRGPPVSSVAQLNAALWVAASDNPATVLPKAVEAFRAMASGRLSTTDQPTPSRMDVNITVSVEEAVAVRGAFNEVVHQED